MTLDKLFEHFVLEKRYMQNCVPNSIKHFRSSYKTFRRFVQAEEVTQAAVNGFMVQARKSGMSVAHSTTTEGQCSECHGTGKNLSAFDDVAESLVNSDMECRNIMVAGAVRPVADPKRYRRMKRERSALR